MKILHLTTHLNTGGITQYIYSLAECMIAFDAVEEIHVLSSGGELEDKFKGIGVIPVTFNIRTKSELSPKVYASILPLRKYIKDHQIDILHAHTRVTQYLARVVSKLFDIPCVTTCHGFYKRRLGRRIFPAWGDAVIAISDSVKKDLEETFHVKPEVATTVYNGINIQSLVSRAKGVDRKKCRQQYGISDETTLVGIVSRIEEDKGFEYLVRAIKILRDRDYNVKLLIAGKGTYENALKKLITELKIDESIVFMGVLENVTIAYQMMDIFCLPSVWREGFGLVVTEAMALKKPIVVSNTGALNTLIQDGYNGRLVLPRNEDQIADRIEDMIENPEKKKIMGENAFKHVNENFSIERMSEQVLDLYSRLI